MKFEHYLKRVEESPEFKKFKQEHKKAYLCAGFFVIDLEQNKNTHQIDYTLPDGRIMTFSLDEGVNCKLSDKSNKKKESLPELSGESKTDLEEIPGIVQDEMKNRVVTDKMNKIIAVFHVHDGKKIWNLQCITAGLGILNIHIDDSDKTILRFDKHSLFDIIKRV
ncbi:hypothetical protein HYW76_04080 [Candidatus Pacearchaeota archaeon]|nr:hypothetical protein [Candidatus Pacearchaeota archaeon]